MSNVVSPRVAFVFSSPWLGGAERSLLNFLEHLPKNVIRPIIILPDVDGPIKSIVRERLGLIVFECSYGLSLPVVGDCSFELRYKEECISFGNIYRELEVDVVVVNTAHVCSAAASAVIAGVPLLLHSHGVIFPRMYGGLDFSTLCRLELLQLNIADRVLVPSGWVLAYYSQLCDDCNVDIKVMPNGAQLPCLEVSAESFEREGHVSEFVMLCTLEPNKGVFTFLEAATITLAKRPDGAKFFVYGDGVLEYRRQIQAFIRSRNLVDKVFLRPKQENVDLIYRRSTAVIVASEVESFSLVAIEAMSYAKPVIATRCGGPDEIVLDEVTGYLIPTADSEVLADRMARFMDDPTLARSMGLAARDRFESLYEINALARNYVAHILGVFEKPQNPESLARKRVLIALSDFSAPKIRPVCSRDNRGSDDFSVSSTSAGRMLSELYAQSVASRVSFFSRLYAFFSNEDPLWDSVSPAFSGLKAFTYQHFRSGSRCRFVLGDDLCGMQYREYLISLEIQSLKTISLAIRPLLPTSKGVVGVEVVSSSGRIVAQILLPISAVRLDAPTDFIIPSMSSDLGCKWSLRVFVRGVCVPVPIYEIQQYSIFDRRVKYCPFVLLQ